MWFRFRLPRSPSDDQTLPERRFCLLAPLRNVEPEESIGALPEGRQLGQIVVALRACGVDPAQLQGEAPFDIVSTHATSDRSSVIARRCA